MNDFTKKELDLLNKEADRLASDDKVEPWENRDLGADENHVRVTKPTSIRLDIDMIEDLKTMAAQEGLDKWQTYLKMVLKRHIKEKKAS